MSERILVTGSAGFIGTNLTKRLMEVIKPDHLRLHWLSKMPVSGGYTTRISYVRGDLRRTEICMAAMKDIDTVYHCAANTAGAASITSDPLSQVTPNLVMNAETLDAAFRAGVKKFVWLSSTTAGSSDPVYAGVGLMKRITEQLCHYYTDRGMRCIVVRPTNVYGPYDKFDEGRSHLMAATIRKAAEKLDPFVVWGDGKDQRDLIYVDDLVDHLLETDDTGPLIVGSGVRYSVKEIVEKVLRIAGHSPTIVFDATRPRTAQKQADYTDVTIPQNLDGGIIRTLIWYKETH